MDNLLAKNSQGQSLVEFLAVLPVFILMMGGLLLTFYFLLATYWADHWVYRSNMCQIEGNSQCQAKLEEKIQIFIPRGNYQVMSHWKTSKESGVALRLNFLDFDFYFVQFSFQKNIRSVIRLPLHSDHSPITLDSP